MANPFENLNEAEKMQTLGTLCETAFPGMAFGVFIFKPIPGDTEMKWISNGDRRTMAEALRKYADRLDSRADEAKN